MMNTNDYSDLKAEFRKIDQTNPKSLRKWFEKYQYLNIQDHATIIGKCSREVRILRRFSGICGQAPKVKERADTKNIDIAELPENWRTKEWLSEYLPKYGSMSIIRATGLTRKRFYEILQKLGVSLPGRINKNPCYNKAWCYRHYIELGYSVRKCAKLAGITHPTFVDWLIKFEISLRVNKEARKSNGKVINIPFELRMLVSKLKQLSIVNEITIYPAHLYVKYRSGVSVRYKYRFIPGNEWVLNSVPKVVYEYETDLENGITYPAHITISNLSQCSRFERDVAIHEFIRQITSRGWIQPTFPTEILLKELEILRNVKESKFIKNGAFTSLHDRHMNRYIMLHFFDHNYIWEYFKLPKYLWKVAKILSKTKLKFNTCNLIRTMTRSRIRFRFPNPALYAVIFRRLGITGKVLDLNLGTGARAVACGLIDCEYRIHDIPRFRQAVDNGFADFMNLRYQYYDNTEIVDLVINDNDLSEADIEYALSFSDRAKQIMVYVPKEKKLEYQEKYKPKHMIKVVTHPMNREPNYFFIW